MKKLIFLKNLQEYVYVAKSINLCCSINILGTIWTSKFRETSVNGWVLWSRLLYVVESTTYERPMSNDELNCAIKKTQAVLGEIFSKPKLTSKLLQRPPFRYDIIFVWHINCKKVFLIYSAKIYPWYHHSNTPCDWFS